MENDGGPATADGGQALPADDRWSAVDGRRSDAALWRCESCGQVLGVRAGRLMHLSLAVAVDVELALRVRCGGCFGWQRWGRDERRGENREARGDLKTLG